MADPISLPIDPSAVLGVGADASLQEIRDAYRAKAKRYHPDAGGEEWAFRVVVQSYELLSTARVARASTRESAAPTPPRAEGTPFRPRPDGGGGGGGGTAHESVRPGVQEAAVDPAQVVDVEKLSIRYQPDHIWLVSEHGRSNHFLSCSLNLSWPGPDLTAPPETIPGHERLLRDIQTVFDAIGARTGAGSARSDITEGRFSGWLSYPSAEAANDAFNDLRTELHRIGLAVHQWTRDLVIPRQGR